MLTQREAAKLLQVSVAYLRASACPKYLLPGNGPRRKPLVRYRRMLGGALLLTALSTVLQGMLMPLAIRNVIFGFVILAAVIGLREKSR